MNIIEELAHKKMHYHYDFSKDEINKYDVKNISEAMIVIEEHYKNVSFKIENINDYIDCIFIKYLNSIQYLDLSLNSEKYENRLVSAKDMINQISSKYQIKEMLTFIKNNYKEIFQYYSKEEYPDERDSIYIHIRLKITKYTIIKVATHLKDDKIQNVIVEYLINNNGVLFFNDINRFKDYYSLFLSKLTENNLIQEISGFRYIELLNFLEANINIFKQSENYDLLIDTLINDIQDNKKHIYQREEECRNLICFLKSIKHVKVRRLQVKYNEISKEVYAEVEKKGHRFEQSFNLRDIAIEYKKMLKDKNTNDVIKLIFPHIYQKNDRAYVHIETISEMESGLASLLFGEDSYYTSSRQMHVEQILINLFNKLFFNLTIKSMGYRKVEKLISGAIITTFNTLLIDYKKEEVISDVKGVMYSIKSCYKKYPSKAERNYNYYIHSFYIIGYIEKILRKLYIAVNENDIYMEDDKKTLKEILRETDDNKIITLIGINLFKWIKFFISNIERVDRKFENRLGYDYRNKMCHYRDVSATEDTSVRIYYTVIYLFLNLIIAMHLNVYTYPSEETEEIIINQLDKLQNEGK
ncbi:MAG: hypothetical protein FWC79_02905 [Oscillospiraceae bacterium]|nr:hypothetical protein [Oscillospiraceae bacterium]